MRGGRFPRCNFTWASICHMRNTETKKKTNTKTQDIFSLRPHSSWEAGGSPDVTSHEHKTMEVHAGCHAKWNTCKHFKISYLLAFEISKSQQWEMKIQDNTLSMMKPNRVHINNNKPYFQTFAIVFNVDRVELFLCFVTFLIRWLIDMPLQPLLSKICFKDNPKSPFDFSGEKVILKLVLKRRGYFVAFEMALSHLFCGLGLTKISWWPRNLGTGHTDMTHCAALLTYSGSDVGQWIASKLNLRYIWDFRGRRGDPHR